MKKQNRGVELSLNVIILIVILLIVLVILAAFFLGGIGTASEPLGKLLGESSKGIEEQSPELLSRAELILLLNW